MKILYIEDETAHVELTQRTLNENLQDGFVLYHADSLQGALKILETESDIDLILTDLRLPDGSGLDLLKWAKGLPSPPAVVLVTGQGDEQVAVTALKAGAADYLVKEGNYLNRLPAALNNAVAQNKLGREQAARNAAEHRFRVVVEQLPAAIYTDNHDDFSSAQYISPQIKEITGFSPDEWLTDPLFWLTRIHPDDLEAVRKEINATHNSLTDFNMEYRVIHRDGRVVWVRDVAKVILDEKGHPENWQGILFDITKEVEAQATLKASEERFKRIFHSTPIATCVVTVDTGRFIDANQAFQNLVGVPLENLVGHTSLELGFWEANQNRDEFINKLREQGVLKGLEIRYLNVPDGPRDTLGFYEMIELGGEPCLLAMFYDVTEQKKTQKALQSERDFALQILNNMGQGLTIIDGDSRFEYVNPAYASMLGYHIEELIGKTPADFTVASGQAALVEERIHRQQGITSTYESKLAHKDGREVPVIITGVPRKQNKQVNGAIAVVTDLTVQKRAEQALERQVQELTALHAVATAEAESLSEDEIIKKVTLAISGIYSDVCGIILLDVTGSVLIPHSSYFGANISNWQKGYPTTDGVTGKSFSSGKIVRTGNITLESGYIEIASGIISELCVPIRVHERIIGVINVESKVENAFTEHDEGFLITVASGLGTALEKIRLFNEEQKRANEFTALYATTIKLTTKWDLQSLLETVLTEAMELLNATGGGIYLHNASRGDLEVAVARGVIMHPGTHMQLGEGMAGRVAQSRSPLIVDDYESWEHRSIQYADMPIRAVIEVPMQYGGELIGVLAVLEVDKSTRKFTETDVELLSLFAAQAASAIKNARLFESEKRRRQEAETLREATNKLTSSVELDELFEIILGFLKKLIPYDSASIELVHQEYCEIVAGEGIPANLIGRVYQVDLNKWGDAEIARQPVTLYDVQKDDRFEKFEGTEYIHGWMGIPLLTQEKLIGFLNLDSRTPGFYTDEFMSLAQTFGNQAAIAIEKARLFQEQNRRSEIIETLANIANEIATTRDVIPALENITQRALELLNANHVAIFLLQEDNVTLKSVTARGTYQKELASHTQKIGDGITGRVLVNGKPEIINDLTKDLRRVRIPGTPADDAKFETLMLAPLILHGKAIGVINAWRLRENGLFNDAELNFLVSIANQASICIESGRLFQETKRQAQEAAAIAEVGRDISSTLQLNVVLERIASYAKDLLHAETSAVFLADENNTTLHAIAAIGLEADEIKDDPLKIGHGILGNIAHQKFGEFVNDTMNDPRAVTIKGTQETPFENIMGVPILFHGVLTGLLAIWRTGKDQEFVVSELEFTTRLAQQAAIALENARLFEAEKKRRQEAETLRQAASAISSTLDLDAVVTEILAALKQVIPYDSGTVFFHEGNQLRIALAEGYSDSGRLKNMTFPADDELFQTMRATGKSIIVDDMRLDPRFKYWGESINIRSWMAVPLVARGRVIGAITLDSHKPGTYSENIGETAMAFAHQAAAAIDNARLYDETQRRLKELEIINRVSTSLRLAQSLDEIIPILLNETLLLVDTPHGSIWLYDTTNNVLTQRIARGMDAGISVTSLKPGEGIIGHVFLSGEKYITSDLSNDPLLFAQNRESATPGLGGISIPIISTVGPMGVLMVSIEKERQLTGVINLLTILAEITGNAIHRAELFKQSQEQIRKLVTLRDIDSAIASSTDLRVTLNILMDHTLKHLKVDAVDIMSYHPELQSLTYLCSAGFNNPSPSRPLIRLGEGLAGQVVMKGRIEHVTDLRISTEVKRDPMLIREGFVTYFGIPLIVKGQTKGVFEIFHRSPFAPSADWMQFLQTLAGQAAIAIDNAQLFDHLQRSNQEVTQAYDTTLEGWARALELRDRETEGHTRRVTELTMQLARYMEISDDELVNIYRGVLLHDIGKMGVPDQILRKTGPLNESEWIEMRKHPEYAFNLLAPIPYLRPALDIPYCHHEHWDGSGYPRGLRGEQIPLAARIFSIVDIWDALLSDRSYRKAWPEPKVIDYLKEISGKILDPKVVMVFLKMIGAE